jgi:hypothetical protein
MEKNLQIMRVFGPLETFSSFRTWMMESRIKSCWGYMGM